MSMFATHDRFTRELVLSNLVEMLSTETNRRFFADTVQISFEVSYLGRKPARRLVIRAFGYRKLRNGKPSKRERETSVYSYDSQFHHQATPIPGWLRITAEKHRPDWFVLDVSCLFPVLPPLPMEDR